MISEQINVGQNTGATLIRAATMLLISSTGDCFLHGLLMVSESEDSD